jgi:hypothetical protein
LILACAEGEIFQIGPVLEGFSKDFWPAADPSKISGSLPFCLLPAGFSLLPTDFALLALEELRPLELTACWLWTDGLYSAFSWSKRPFCLEDCLEICGDGLAEGRWFCSGSSKASLLAFY